MDTTISNNILNTMLDTGIIAFIIPLGLITTWKVRSKKSLIPFFAGMLVFIFFGKILAMIPHAIFLLSDNPISEFFKGTGTVNIIVYALYGSLITGIFEETGRYFCFRKVLTDFNSKKDSISYGIGHGGMECMIVLGVGYLQYYFYGSLINKGSFDKILNDSSNTKATIDSAKELINTISSVKASDCYLAGVERFIMYAVSIALSVVVFEAVRRKKAAKEDNKIKTAAGGILGIMENHLFLTAVIMHMVVILPMGFCQAGVIGKVAAEAIIAVIAIIIVIYARYLYMDMPADKTTPVKEEKESISEFAKKKFNKPEE